MAGRPGVAEVVSGVFELGLGEDFPGDEGPALATEGESGVVDHFAGREGAFEAEGDAAELAAEFGAHGGRDAGGGGDFARVVDGIEDQVAVEVDDELDIAAACGDAQGDILTIWLELSAPVGGPGAATSDFVFVDAGGDERGELEHAFGGLGHFRDVAVGIPVVASEFGLEAGGEDDLIGVGVGWGGFSGGDGGGADGLVPGGDGELFGAEVFEKEGGSEPDADFLRAIEEDGVRLGAGGVNLRGRGDEKGKG